MVLEKWLKVLHFSCNRKSTDCHARGSLSKRDLRACPRSDKLPPTRPHLLSVTPFGTRFLSNHAPPFCPSFPTHMFGFVVVVLFCICHWPLSLPVLSLTFILNVSFYYCFMCLLFRLHFFFAHLSLRAHRCHRRASDSPGTAVTHDCDLSCRCWELNSTASAFNH